MLLNFAHLAFKNGKLSTKVKTNSFYLLFYLDFCWKRCKKELNNFLHGLKVKLIQKGLKKNKTNAYSLNAPDRQWTWIPNRPKIWRWWRWRAPRSPPPRRCSGGFRGVTVLSDLNILRVEEKKKTQANPPHITVFWPINCILHLGLSQHQPAVSPRKNGLMGKKGDVSLWTPREAAERRTQRSLCRSAALPALLLNITHILVQKIAPRQNITLKN